MGNRLGILLIVVLAAAGLGGWVGDKISARPPSQASQPLLTTLAEAVATVEEHYVHSLSGQSLVESAIHGLLRTLDPHSSYFTTSDYSQLQEQQREKYYGLGILIRPVGPGTSRVVIVDPPAPETPGYKAGLRVGDVISKIDGEAIGELDYPDEVVSRLRGPKGTTVNISVERRGVPEPFEVSVERDEIPLHTIKYVFHLGPHIGYIRLNKFSGTTGDELDRALEQLDEKSLEGLILDLRDNPGGALSQAIEVADRFLKKGQLIVSTRGRHGKGRQYHAPEGQRHNYPLVVLINESSASASEIVAGALQDHDRALIVGRSSFGKALVQTIYPLPGNRGLALTTGRYYTPSGRLIQREYSDSLYDYYYSRGDPDQDHGQEHHTDRGRVVFAGGGITPDEEVSRQHLSRLGQLIAGGNFFYEFAADLQEENRLQDVLNRYFPKNLTDLTLREKDEAMNQVFMGGDVLLQFKEFLRQKNVAFTDESFQKTRQLIESRLKQELFLTLLGDKESFRISLEVDQQVQRAVKLLSKAQALLQRQNAKTG
ncbi:MAG: S41 family peptidase [Acidobacteriota bacterium]